MCLRGPKGRQHSAWVRKPQGRSPQKFRSPEGATADHDLPAPENRSNPASSEESSGPTPRPFMADPSRYKVAEAFQAATPFELDDGFPWLDLSFQQALR
jgi:hypothetical protein